MRARIAIMLLAGVLVAAPLSQAQMRGGWGGHSGGGFRGGFVPNQGSTFVLPNPFPTPGIQPLIVSPFNQRSPFIGGHRHAGGRFPTVAIPVYYPASSVSGYESDQDLSYARAYSNGLALQVVTGSGQNSQYPTREAQLERRLEDQAYELEQMKRERNAA